MNFMIHIKMNKIQISSVNILITLTLTLPKSSLSQFIDHR